MKFDDLDKKMRIFETARDYCIMPGTYIVTRMDGRNFTRLTKEVYEFKAPFDEQFRDYMIETTKHLMNCGFKIVYGYTQSDEISLLFHFEDNTFGRKTRKINSILAGEASAMFTKLLNGIACFDCRVSELPNKEAVIDYFHWRQSDAHRNSLNAHCYWALRKEGASYLDATNLLSGMSVANKNELLFNNGINYNDLPNWHKRGTGIYWKNFVKKGYNPKENIEVETIRRNLYVDLNIPMGKEYSDMLNGILNSVD